MKLRDGKGHQMDVILISSLRGKFITIRCGKFFVAELSYSDNGKVSMRNIGFLDGSQFETEGERGYIKVTQ